MDQSNIKLQFEQKLEVGRLYDLWSDFCEMHTSLYEITCDEYMHLLASDINSLEDSIQDKTKILEQINNLETRRQELSESLAASFKEEKPQKLSDLITMLTKHGEAEIAGNIEKLNLVLIDIIEKIQEQNKKNQVFLNKAIYSLKELRESFTGKKKSNTYSARGITGNHIRA